VSFVAVFTFRSWIWLENLEGFSFELDGTVWLTVFLVMFTEIEPFDAKLAQRVQALSAQIESQTLELASLRRNAPGATAKKFEEEFKRRSEEDEARVKKQEEIDAEAARELKLDVGDMERLGEVQGTWQRGTEELEELKGKVGGTIARMERAKRAVEFVEGSS
jgi:kinetochor protein Mis14/NSL1